MRCPSPSLPCLAESAALLILEKVMPEVLEVVLPHVLEPESPHLRLVD